MTRRARSLSRFPGGADGAACGVRRPGAPRGVRGQAHRQDGQRERTRWLVGVDDDETAARRVLAPVDRCAAQLLDAVGGHHDGQVAFVLDEVVAAGEADRIERQPAAVFAVG